MPQNFTPPVLSAGMLETWAVLLPVAMWLLLIGWGFAEYQRITHWPPPT